MSVGVGEVDMFVIFSTLRMTAKYYSWTYIVQHPMTH